MKKTLSIACLLLALSFGAMAQENPINKGLGFGFQLNQYQRDFGFGLNVTSPFFVQDHIAVRMRGNLMYLEHLKNSEVTWTPYTNATLGVIGVGGYATDYIRLYGEGGLICILPNNEFSEETASIGGYGLFGFEFYMEKSSNYFIEIGSVGSGSVADKIPTKPMYSNGLTISTGFRVSLD